jgi:hypothetical protein
VAVGVDLTRVTGGGQWLTVGVSVDAGGGLALTVDVLDSAEAVTVSPWVEAIAAAVGATVLVRDDAAACKTAADESGLEHRVCTAQVVRTTEAWGTALVPVLAADADGSLAAIEVTPAPAVADAEELLRLVQEREPTPKAAAPLEAIHRRYLKAAPPLPGASATLADRLRLFSLDRWQLWPRLTRYRSWEGPDGEQRDGTDNGCERAIGWWVKERYRSMRGYKRKESGRTVRRLIAWMGNALGGPGADLALLFKSARTGGGGRPGATRSSCFTPPSSEQSPGRDRRDRRAGRRLGVRLRDRRCRGGWYCARARRCW